MPSNEVIEHSCLKLCQLSVGARTRITPARVPSFPVIRRAELRETEAEPAPCSGQRVSARPDKWCVLKSLFWCHVLVSIKLHQSGAGPCSCGVQGRKDGSRSVVAEIDIHLFQ